MKDLTEINIETVRELRSRGLHEEADAMIKEHQRLFKEGMKRARRVRMNDTNLRRKYHFKRLSICYLCGRTKVKEKGAICDACKKRKNEVSNEYNRKKRRERKGNCEVCKKKITNIGFRKYCSKECYRIGARQRKIEKRQRDRQHIICRRCGTNENVKRLYCVDCRMIVERQQRQKSNDKLRLLKKKNLYCIDCGIVVEKGQHIRCKKCAEKNKKELYQRKHYQCIYCGQKLIGREIKYCRACRVESDKKKAKKYYQKKKEERKNDM